MFSETEIISAKQTVCSNLKTKNKQTATQSRKKNLKSWETLKNKPPEIWLFLKCSRKIIRVTRAIVWSFLRNVRNAAHTLSDKRYAEKKVKLFLGIQKLFEKSISGWMQHHYHLLLKHTISQALTFLSLWHFLFKWASNYGIKEEKWRSFCNGHSKGY